MAEKTDTKKKRPTAQKRMLQNEKRRLINKSRKSQIRTAIRDLRDAKEKGEKVDEQLKTVYSLVDKAVKSGLYKKNKASRTKARLAAVAAK